MTVRTKMATPLRLLWSNLRQSNLLPAAICALVAGLVAICKMGDEGANVSWDSYEYLTMANGMMNGGWRWAIFENGIADWPPFYPLILAFFGTVFGVGAFEAAYLANVAFAASFGALLAGALAHFWGTRIGAMCAALVAILCFPLSNLWHDAMSEGPFVSLVLLTLSAVCWRKTSTWMQWVYVGCLAACVALTRYIGIVIVPVIAIFAFTDSHSQKERFKKTVAVTIPPFAAFALYLLRNFYITGTAMGNRYPPARDLQDNVALLFKSLKTFFVPLKLANSYIFQILGNGVLCSIVIIVIAIACYFLLRGKVSTLNDSRAKKSFMAHVLWLWAYGSFLLASSTTTAFEPIGWRMTVPLVPSILFLVYPLVLELCRHMENRAVLRRLAQLLLLIGAGLAIVVAYKPFGGLRISALEICTLATIVILALIAWHGIHKALISVLVIFTATMFLHEDHGGLAIHSNMNQRMWSRLYYPFLIEQTTTPAIVAEFQCHFRYAQSVTRHCPNHHGIKAPRHYGYEAKDPTGITPQNVFEKFPELDGALLLIEKEITLEYSRFWPEDYAIEGIVTPIIETEEMALYWVRKKRTTNGNPRHESTSILAEQTGNPSTKKPKFGTDGGEECIKVRRLPRFVSLREKNHAENLL